MVDVSIIFATHRRTKILERTLESLASLRIGDFTWEVMVIDNAVDEDTKNIANRYESVLPIRYLSEPKKGKNRALNKGISHAKGSLFVFTDDDIIADTNWLSEMWQGSMRWPTHSVFGGTILPHWPSGKPPIAANHSFFRNAYVVADWEFPEGPYSAGYVWGPNMAIRSNIFAGSRLFDTSIGPKGSNYIMGSESSFVRRLEIEGFQAVFLPRAVVLHQIRQEQMSLDWVKRRAFRYGRKLALEESEQALEKVMGVPRYLIRRMLESYCNLFMSRFSTNRMENAEEIIRHWETKGMLYQHVNRAMAKFAIRVSKN